MPPDRSTVLHVSKAGWCIIGAAFVLPWVLVFWLLQRPPAGRPPAPAAPSIAASAAAPAPASEIQSGPWGELEFQRIALEPPEEFIRPDAGNPAPVRWTFNAATPESIDALWRRTGLDDATRQELNRQLKRVDADTVAVEPPARLILGLSPETRGALYSALAEFPENHAQREPFRFRADAVEEWFAGTRVSAPILALTRRLLYRRHNAVLFSDQDVVLPQIPEMAERIAFLKMLARRSALIVRLHVAHDADIDELARYWRHDRRGKDVKPLLASLAQRPDGGFIDIVHLLPPFARSLLNTYPTPGQFSASHDCHWTSFNFFEDAINERYSDIEFVKQTLLTDYYPVSGAPALGDIILFVQSDGVVLHSCVQIADGIVFTKNGPSVFVPWTLSRLENVIAAYSLGSSVPEIRRYRARQP